MHATLEYIGVTLSLIVMILVAQYSLAVFLRDTSHVREEQLYTIAERVMDKIVLTTGYPPDWGYNFTAYNATLQDFGLAMHGTHTPYLLDPDKVMRLANFTILPNPIYLNSSYIAKLLGLEDDYGFVLEMVPLLNQKIEVLRYYVVGAGHSTIKLPAKFKVILKNYYNMTVPSANVTGIFTLISVESGPGGSVFMDIEEIFTKSNITNIKGECTLDFYDELLDFYSGVPPGLANKRYLAILLIHVNWYGFVSVNAYTETVEEAPATGYVFGNYIILEKDVSVIPRAAVLVKDEVIQAVPEYRSLFALTAIELVCNGTTPPENKPPCYIINSGRFTYRVYRVEYVEKLASHIFVIAQWRGQIISIVIDRMPQIKIKYGHYVEPANAVTLIRDTRIFNYPYIIKLTLWRTVEG